MIHNRRLLAAAIVLAIAAAAPSAKAWWPNQQRAIAPTHSGNSMIGGSTGTFGHQNGMVGSPNGTFGSQTGSGNLQGFTSETVVVPASRVTIVNPQEFVANPAPAPCCAYRPSPLLNLDGGSALDLGGTNPGGGGQIQNGFITPQPSPVPVDASVNADVLQQSVVRISCAVGKTGGKSGSGFLHESGAIITAGHVVSGCNQDSIAIDFADGTHTGISSGTINKDLDLAVIRPDTDIGSRKVVKLAEKDAQVGEAISFWGYPGAYTGFPIVATGIVAGEEASGSVYYEGKTAHRYGTPIYILNAAVNHGNSGGPLIRLRDGAILGVITSKNEKMDSMGYVIPIAALDAFLESENIKPRT